MPPYSHNIIKRLSSILLLFCLILSGLAHGQTASASLLEQGPGIRMLLLAQGGPSIELYYFSEGMAAPEGPILVGSRGLSKPFKVPSNEFILAIQDTSLESGYRPVAHATLEDIHSHYTLLLLPETNRLKVYAVNSDAKTFNSSSVLFFNASDVPLAVKMESEVTIIKPLTPIQVPIPEQTELPWYQVSLFEPKGDGQARIFSNTRWPHQRASRTYIFLFRNSNNNRMSYKAIDEPIASR